MSKLRKMVEVWVRSVGGGWRLLGIARRVKGGWLGRGVAVVELGKEVDVGQEDDSVNKIVDEIDDALG